MEGLLAQASSLMKRHIQDHSLNATTQNHWGYAERQMPCLNDPGSCDYLDEAYAAHDRGLIYVGVIWLTIVAVLAAWGTFRILSPKTNTSRLGRLCNVVAATGRRYLLPDAVRAVFGRTTRLQVLILAISCGYLTIWSFIGMVYGTWITPVKDMPGTYNTRTTLGPWSNRVGVIAYALTPLSVMLASRESLLSMITGVPYQHFNFLHRWLGYVILVQSSLHTIGWCIIQIRLYQPQPKVRYTFFQELYLIWGIVAMGLILVLYIFSLPFVIRRTGYEFFRKSHYVLAMVYAGACIAHWEKLHCFLTPAIALWFLDRFIRLGRTWLLHRRGIDKSHQGLFQAANARFTIFSNTEDGDVVRLDFRHPHKPWNIGQHFYLCFTEGSIWQSHPFTPLNAPKYIDNATEHSYLFRAKGGETRKIAGILKKRKELATEMMTTPVILTGPYGESLERSHRADENILCIAGGTGITYVLPLILAIARDGTLGQRKIELVWLIRHRSDAEWIRPELDELSASGAGANLKIRIFTTRDSNGEGNVSDTATTSSKEKSQDAVDSEKGVNSEAGTLTIRPAAATETAEHTGHPAIGPILQGFLAATVQGPTTVVASGPGGMMSELRRRVAEANDGGRVWKGEDRFDVSLQCDDRMEH